MKKVAVFGKPGSGKSTLSKTLAAATGLPLYQLDRMVYRADGSQVEPAVYHEEHQKIVQTASWIIDGFGAIDSFYKRLDAADTLVYIDLPYAMSYWLVTKRLLKGLFVKPEGWPAGSSLIKGTLQSYKTLKLCPKFWNPAFLASLQQRTVKQSVYHITTVAELNSFVLDSYNDL